MLWTTINTLQTREQCVVIFCVFASGVYHRCFFFTFAERTLWPHTRTHMHTHTHTHAHTQTADLFRKAHSQKCHGSWLIRALSFLFFYERNEWQFNLAVFLCVEGNSTHNQNVLIDRARIYPRKREFTSRHSTHREWLFLPKGWNFARGRQIWKGTQQFQTVDVLYSGCWNTSLGCQFVLFTMLHWSLPPPIVQKTRRMSSSHNKTDSIGVCSVSSKDKFTLLPSTSKLLTSTAEFWRQRRRQNLTRCTIGGRQKSVQTLFNGPEKSCRRRQKKLTPSPMWKPPKSRLVDVSPGVCLEIQAEQFKSFTLFFFWFCPRCCVCSWSHFFPEKERVSTHQTKFVNQTRSFIFTTQNLHTWKHVHRTVLKTIFFAWFDQIEPSPSNLLIFRPTLYPHCSISCLIPWKIV